MKISSYFSTCAAIGAVALTLGCSSSESPVTSDGGGATDGGGTPSSSCAALMSGNQPYVCFTISGEGTTYDVAYPRVPPSAFQVYFGTSNRSFFRMNGLPKVNSANERVTVDFTFGGTAPGAEAWRTDIGGGGSGPIIIFFGPDIGSGDTKERREFRPIEGSTDLGTTTITRFGAVGELVEGTFKGVGKLDVRLPSPTILERVDITGRFRVTRAPDAM